jgi:hypothetical protein
MIPKKKKKKIDAWIDIYIFWHIFIVNYINNKFLKYKEFVNLLWCSKHYSPISRIYTYKVLSLSLPFLWKIEWKIEISAVKSIHIINMNRTSVVIFILEKSLSVSSVLNMPIPSQYRHIPRCAETRLKLTTYARDDACVRDNTSSFVGSEVITHLDLGMMVPCSRSCCITGVLYNVQSSTAIRTIHKCWNSCIALHIFFSFVFLIAIWVYFQIDATEKSLLWRNEQQVCFYIHYENQ